MAMSMYSRGFLCEDISVVGWVLSCSTEKDSVKGVANNPVLIGLIEFIFLTPAQKCFALCNCASAV